VPIDPFDSQQVLGRFNRLMKDVLAGGASRNTFEPWEVDLLLDIARCELEPARARAVLVRYHQAAGHQLDLGRLPPLKLSEYLRLHQPAS